MDALEAHLQRQIERSRDFFWHRVRWLAVTDQIAGGNFALTDVGAGIGLVGEFLARDYPHAIYRFVEPLGSLVSELESRFGAQANANDSDSYAESRYITLLDVLEHIEDDRGFLEDLVAQVRHDPTCQVRLPDVRPGEQLELGPDVGRLAHQSPRAFAVLPLVRPMK